MDVLAIHDRIDLRLSWKDRTISLSYADAGDTQEYSNAQKALMEINHQVSRDEAFSSVNALTSPILQQRT